MSLKSRKVVATGLIVLFGGMVLGQDTRPSGTLPGTMAGLIGYVTGLVLVLLGLLFSIRWRMRLAYGHHPPILQKIKRRRVDAVTLIFLLSYWTFLSLFIMGDFGTIPGVVAFVTLGLGFGATIYWLRRLKRREEEFYRQANAATAVAGQPTS